MTLCLKIHSKFVQFLSGFYFDDVSIQTTLFGFHHVHLDSMGVEAVGARFLSLAQSKLRLCSANHRAGYFSNLDCDWLSIVWAYFEQETENGPWSGFPLDRVSAQNAWCGFILTQFPLISLVFSFLPDGTKARGVLSLPGSIRLSICPFCVRPAVHLTKMQDNSWNIFQIFLKLCCNILWVNILHKFDHVHCSSLNMHIIDQKLIEHLYTFRWEVSGHSLPMFLLLGAVYWSRWPSGLWVFNIALV